MKNKTTLFLTFLLIIFGCINAKAQLLTRTEYKWISGAEQPVLKLTLTLKDTSEVKNPMGFTSRQANQTKEVGLDDFKSQMIEYINGNSGLEIYIKRPEYMNQIFNLITNPANKEKAIRIFNENNYKNAILTFISQGISTGDGKTEKKLTIEFTVPIVVKTNTTLILKPITFEFDSKEYITEKLEIETVE